MAAGRGRPTGVLRHGSPSLSVMARGRRTDGDFAEAGAAIVAESGWAALTPPALAQHLGVHATAVYRHFATWDAFIAAVFDLGLAQLLDTTMADVPLTAAPRERVLAFMRSVRIAADADPYIADCILAILRSETQAVMPNFDAATVVVTDLLREIGVPEEQIPVMHQAIEGLALGSILADYMGHPLHIANRRYRRRMSGVAAFEEFTRSDETTKAVSDAAFELTARLLLDECERLGAATVAK